MIAELVVEDVGWLCGHCSALRCVIARPVASQQHAGQTLARLVVFGVYNPLPALEWGTLKVIKAPITIKMSKQPSFCPRKSDHGKK